LRKRLRGGDNTFESIVIYFLNSQVINQRETELATFYFILNITFYMKVKKENKIPVL
jgi:hypothetical protein